jgi:hypothetical protein
MKAVLCRLCRIMIAMIGLNAWMLTATALAAATRADCPQTAHDLYQRIRSVPLDRQRIYRVRDAAIDRPNLHIDFDDGTLAFTEDICGRITGAAFEGEGEVRLSPPNREERGSLALFTGMAILEEQITSAYLRFNDDTAAALRPFLSPAPESASFLQEWSDVDRTLAQFDTLRLLLDFSHFLPVTAGSDPERKFPPLLHAHLIGKKLGVFEVFWDADAGEPLSAGQTRIKDGFQFFDTWTSFAPVAATVPPSQVGEASITSFHIQASVHPPTTLRASADMDVTIRGGGARTLLFELSRYLKVDTVDADGHPTDFIQNPAIEGSELQRKGNDLVAVVFPVPLAAGQKLKLSFRYAGEVLSEAGIGLLYVGERGTWYPNLGLSPAKFDMEFHYPANWTLVATGKKMNGDGGADRAANPEAAAEKESEKASERVSRWISERPIPVAGFNLGKYVRADVRADSVLVEAYGTRGVEKSFPKAPNVIEKPAFPIVTPPHLRSMGPILVTPPPPSPANDVQAVAGKAARAIETFSKWFGPYPYSSLALTQMPGDLSQGWPGLVFLSSFAFLSPQEQTDLHLNPVTRELASQVLVHETAHQWWGDLVGWNSYHDQWIVEGLANYSSLLMLEQQKPEQFRTILEQYRRDLLSKNNDGERLREAGPVTLGWRLQSSHFPDGYDEISYERGTWLFHMLRCMLRDAALHNFATSHSSKGHADSPPNSEELFFRTLRKIRNRYAGKTLSTQQLVQAFEEDLPRPLWYEKRPKLDWFLEGWIEGTAIPALEARDIHIIDRSGATAVSGVIVQKDAPDDLVTAVPVYASTSGNTLVFLGEVLADGRETAFRLTAPGNIRKVVVDPFQTILTAPK